MDPMPLAGTFCPSLEEARQAACYPLTWVECQQCSLIQVLEDIPDSVLFSKYNYQSSSVGGLVRHFVEFSELLAQKYHSISSLRYLEIGCNDGVLLRRLPKNWQLWGFDPSDVARQAATPDCGYTLINAPFQREQAIKHKLSGQIDVVSGSNCLAHVTDLREIFLGVHEVLKPGGHFWVEVHDLNALLENQQWDTIYHEHKAEWSIDSLQRCVESVGFSLVEYSRQPLHGGLLRVCFAKSEVLGNYWQSHPPRAHDPRLQTLRRSYQERMDHPVAREMMSAQERGQSLSAYGASGRANVFLNQMRPLHFEYIVDESPLRSGKHIPRVMVPIVHPAVLKNEPTDLCLITAWNYSQDIMKKHPEYKGAWRCYFLSDV